MPTKKSHIYCYGSECKLAVALSCPQLCQKQTSSLLSTKEIHITDDIFS